MEHLSFDPVSPFLGVDTENAPAQIQLVCRVIHGGIVCGTASMGVPRISDRGEAVEETIVHCRRGALSERGNSAEDLYIPVGSNSRIHCSTQGKQGRDALFTCTACHVVRKRKLHICMCICVYFCLHHKEKTRN